MRQSMRVPGMSRTARVKSVPSPFGGLNARDSLADMKPTDAIVLENYFPKTSSVDVRNGSSNWSTGIGSPTWVETLMAYNGTSTKSLFGAAGGSIYDCTISGAVGAAKVTGLSNARFQYSMIGTAAGKFLVAINGADKLQGYDGTNWWADGDGAHDITGFDTSLAINVNLWKNRLWFVQKNSMIAWYLGTQAIAGAASSIDLSTLFRLGGHLIAMFNWTIDNVSGVDEYAVFLTSEGEYAVYKGTDPTSITTFALVGVFRIGRPVGQRCFVKVGSDVLIICVDGIFPLDKSLDTERSQVNLALSDKIRTLINSDIVSYGANFGWQIMLCPVGQKLIVNVPQSEDTTQYQYVMNTETRAWCKFTAWNAACFEIFNDALYYGGKGVVVQADTGTSDNSANINCDAKQAFNYFGEEGEQKRFTACRPLLSSTGTINAALALNVDFEDKQPTSTPSFSGSGGSLWDVSFWDVAMWSASAGMQKHWQTVSGVGYCGALRMKIAAKNFGVSWLATDFAYEPGGVL